MQLPTLFLVAGLVVAVATAAMLGGALGAGVVVGYVMGGMIGGLVVAWVRHTMRTQPQRALAVQVGGFLFKLVVVLMGGLVFRFVEPAAARVDYRTFLISFAAAALLLALSGIGPAMSSLQGRNAS